MTQRAARRSDIWVTLEDKPRRLIVRGRALIDPDCLVAHLEGEPAESFWIVDGGGKIDRCFVAGLDVLASKVMP